MHVEIRILAKAVRLCMMLEMPVIPPAGRCSLQNKANARGLFRYLFPDQAEQNLSARGPIILEPQCHDMAYSKAHFHETHLQMSNHKFVNPVVPFRLAKDRKMSKIMLQPTGLGLENIAIASMTTMP